MQGSGKKSFSVETVDVGASIVHTLEHWFEGSWFVYRDAEDRRLVAWPAHRIRSVMEVDRPDA
jgi:hypothetical protein